MESFHESDSLRLIVKEEQFRGKQTYFKNRHIGRFLGVKGFNS